MFKFPVKIDIYKKGVKVKKNFWKNFGEIQDPYLNGVVYLYIWKLSKLKIIIIL